MPTVTTLLLFAVATLVQTATPGPGVIYLSTRTLTQGRRAGFASMFGIESGEVVWIAAAATGVAALLAASPDTLIALRFSGAAYLVYLGIRRWRQTEAIGPATPAPLRRLFVQGFVTQMLNPKVTLFFVAFLPLFLNPRESVLPQTLALGAVYVAVALMVDTSYVLGLAAVARRFMASRNAQRRAGRVAAGTYIALGLAAAVAGERPSS